MNAKIELKNHLAAVGKEVVAIEIYLEEYIYLSKEDQENGSWGEIRTVGTSFEDVADWLDFEYDCGYGKQQIFGTVWYSDGSWCERREYDGSEWWLHNELPKIPEDIAPTKTVPNDTEQDKPGEANKRYILTELIEELSSVEKLRLLGWIAGKCAKDLEP